ncbi:hypothetical protein [Burkholderia stagnalis]|uniref:hypothetical protein n=1 Tax=Burkholderia stagnalis TaxID=1503054 RepID=UPI000F57F297|nr:hypothetical protein [Burkholderia stagnalis]RQR11331.1 hypothetical protein DF025_17350 [Burkholderia stagnalis]RQR20359.1 hypothetical protein DF026_17160 [Burkholderia stagnalis]
MAKSIGAIRFKNGDLLYLLWNHVVDNAFPKLFATREEAEAAWDVAQGDEVYALAFCAGGEEVELTEWYNPGEFKVSFRTRVDRQKMVIVGPLNLERSWDEFGEPSIEH